MRCLGFCQRIRDDEGILALRLCSRYDPNVFAAQLRNLDKPTLIAWARRDPVVEPAVCEAIIACANDPEVLRFDAKTHNLQSSHATELADALVDWVEQASPLRKPKTAPSTRGA